MLSRTAKHILVGCIRPLKDHDFLPEGMESIHHLRVESVVLEGSIDLFVHLMKLNAFMAQLEELNENV